MTNLEKIKLKYTDCLFISQKTPCDILPIKAEGSLKFADVDYEDKTLSEWKTPEHLRRACRIAASGGKDKLKSDKEFRDTVLSLFNFWLKNDFTNPNWWHNQIGVPRLVSYLCLFLRDYLSDEQKEMCEKILLRGSLGGNTAINSWTGANLMWGIFGTVNHALISDNSELLKTAVDRAMREVDIMDGLKEGIKPDMSFYQHGPMIYTYGYGRDFSHDCAVLFYILSGTEFMPSQEKTGLFEDFILDGSRWFACHCFADYMTVGREISRKNALSLEKIAFALKLMTETAEYKRKDEISSFYRSLTDKSAPQITGLREFKNSYMIVSRTNNTYMSAKGVHKDYLCCEAGNYENYLSANFFSGQTVCFMSKGDEYFNLSPVYDYSVIPGVTAFLQNDEKLLERMGNYAHWINEKGKTDCFGLKCKNGIGVMAMEIVNDGITGYCSRITKNGNMLLLTSSINAGNDCCQNVVTAVDQCRLRENCTVKTGEKQLILKGSSVTNGAFTYTNLSDTPLFAEAINAKGNWKRNNLDMTTDPVETGVFKLYFEHKKAPSNASCAVLVSENGSEMPFDVSDISLLQNCHSVKISPDVKIDISFENDQCEISFNPCF